MKLTLIPNWKAEIKRLWSVRILVLMAVAQGLYYVWPVFQDKLPLGYFVGGSIGLSLLTLIARLIKQREPDDEPPEA